MSGKQRVNSRFNWWNLVGTFTISAAAGDSIPKKRPILCTVAIRKKDMADSADVPIPRAAAIYPAVSEEIVRILSILPSASLVVAADGTVLRASSRALTLGIVNRSSLAVADIAEIVAKVADDGSPREQVLRVRRPPLG